MFMKASYRISIKTAPEWPVTDVAFIFGRIAWPGGKEPE
jgi:hypothetical protein